VELLFSVLPLRARVAEVPAGDGLGDLVEVAGADLALVAGGGVAVGSIANSRS